MHHPPLTHHWLHQQAVDLCPHQGVVHQGHRDEGAHLVETEDLVEGPAYRDTCAYTAR